MVEPRNQPGPVPVPVTSGIAWSSTTLKFIDCASCLAELLRRWIADIRLCVNCGRRREVRSSQLRYVPPVIWSAQPKFASARPFVVQYVVWTVAALVHVALFTLPGATEPVELRLPCVLPRLGVPWSKTATKNPPFLLSALDCTKGNASGNSVTYFPSHHRF